MGEKLTWAEREDLLTNTVYTGSDEPRMEKIIVGYTDKTPEEQGIPRAQYGADEAVAGEGILTIPEDCTVNLRRLARSLHHLTHPVEDK